VHLCPIPSPDHLDFTLPDGHVCLVTDDGSVATVRLAEAMKAQGWPVILAGFPQSLVPTDVGREMPGDMIRVAFEACDDGSLGAYLATVEEAHGPVACFVHMNGANRDDVLFSDRERVLVKAVFFIAKHLKRSLNSAAGSGRASFMTVTRLDGMLGMSGEGVGAFAGGLSGLTKTLSLEWPGVFCRAVDLSPAIGADQAAAIILQELHDPNRLVSETGWSDAGRVTVRI
jgi:hypothetical protein